MMCLCLFQWTFLFCALLGWEQLLWCDIEFCQFFLYWFLVFSLLTWWIILIYFPKLSQLWRFKINSFIHNPCMYDWILFSNLKNIKQYNLFWNLFGMNIVAKISLVVFGWCIILQLFTFNQPTYMLCLR